MSTPVQGLYATEPEPTVPMLHQSLASVMISKSPLHCWYQAFGEAEEDHTEATDTGTLAHALLLGGKDIVAVDAADWRTNAAKAIRDEARADGKIPVLAHKLTEAEALYDLVMAALPERGVNLSGQSEVTAIWQSPIGVWCQGRMDHWIEKSATIYDLKFCQSASPEYISKAMVQYGADVQQAAYRQAIETIYPQLAGRVDFIFIYIEPEPPNAITIVRPDGEMKKMGESKWGKAVDMWKKYLEEYGTKEPWPQYTNQIMEIAPPGYANLDRWNEREEIRDGGNL